MRPFWSGALSFGLVNIPVRLYSATAGKALDLDYLHKTDKSPIRYARVCREDGKEIPYEDIVRGYEYREGDYVILTDEDFKKVNLKKTRTIDVVRFVDAAEIDLIYPEKPYYLEPAGSDKAYVVLREALRKSGKVGVAKFVLRDREHLGVVKPLGDFLVLNQMRYAAEIESPRGLSKPEAAKPTGKEIELALTIIDHLSGPFAPEKFHDTYREEVDEMIAKKAKGKTVRVKGVEPKMTRSADLMKALRASLVEAKVRHHYPSARP
jgi:DNA end-binding protein Ku